LCYYFRAGPGLLATSYRQAGFHMQAYDGLKWALERNPFSPDLLANLLMVQIELGKVDEARISYARLRALKADVKVQGTK